MIALSESLSIKKFDSHRWIVNTSEGKNILMNESAIGLLTILNGSTSNQEAQEKFQEEFHQNITKEDFEVLVKRTFKGLNILSSEESTPFKKSSYLNLKVPLLNPWLAGLLASPLTIFFRPSFFWPAFIATFSLNAVFSLSSFRAGTLTIGGVDVVLMAILVFASMLIHELGHIAACRQFGIKHGVIGFGFYFIFPVVYADITHVWNATRLQRIVANSGGIYAELIYSSVLLLFYSLTKDVSLLVASFTIFIKTITELNPFIRYDGYWLLSDITNTPNLMSKANKALIKLFSLETFRNGFRIRAFFADSRIVLLTFYGLANTILLVAYLTFVIVNFHLEIVQFPNSVVTIFQKAAQWDISFKDIPDNFLWILGFYLLVGKFVVQRVSRWAKKIIH